MFPFCFHQKYGVLFPPDETLLQKAADKFNEESAWVTVSATAKNKDSDNKDNNSNNNNNNNDSDEESEAKKTTEKKTTTSEATTKTTPVAETTPLWKILTTRYELDAAYLFVCLLISTSIARPSISRSQNQLLSASL